MVNQQILEGSWNEIKGQIRKRWAQLTDNDLPQFGADLDQLAGIIQRKTGESREAIERYLEEFASGASSSVGAAAETARQYTQRAAESVQHSARRAADQMRAGYIETERFVRDRPLEAVGVAFGAGVLTGVLLTLILRAR